MAMTRPVRVDYRIRDLPISGDGPPIWFPFRISFSQISGVAASTVNFDVQFTNPWTQFEPYLIIHGAFISSVANWVGGTLASATLSVGTTGTPTAYVAATSVFTGSPKTIAGATQVPGTFLAANPFPTSTLATVRVQWIGSANANQLTAGKSDIYLQLSAPSIRPV